MHDARICIYLHFQDITCNGFHTAKLLLAMFFFTISSCYLLLIDWIGSWNRLWTQTPFTMQSVQACMEACKHPSDGVRNTFITVWGDDGNEVDMYDSFHHFIHSLISTSTVLFDGVGRWSIVAGMAYFAEHGYTKASEINVQQLKYSFRAICEADFDDWVTASQVYFHLMMMIMMRFC